MAGIALEGVSKVFGSHVVAVNDVSLEIADGEFIVLVGPSGCGKSTILRLLAGLEDVTAGEIVIGDRNVTDLPAKERDVAMVFQNYALYPHMSVERNIGFGLRLRRQPKREVARRVREVARTLGLEELLDRKPDELSGGQRQRVAMGRAIVREPAVFLMDEPLSNLDAKLRVQMRGELARLHKHLRTTTVFVTHDQVEAMTLGQRVAVLRDGVLQQVDNPQVLFHRPANLFVAAFIGSPPMNLVEATIRNGSVSFGGFTLPLPELAAMRDYEGKTIVLGIRPSDFEDASLHADSGRPTLEVKAEVIEELGTEVHILFSADARPAATDDVLAASSEEGEAETTLPLTGEGEALFCASVDPRTRARSGSPVRLAVDTERFHFFDRETGDALRSVRARETLPGELVRE
jgi:multiple sugar transport system ATP-binding protein